MMITLAPRQTETVHIGPARLTALAAIPTSPIGLVIFAHGSGSGHLSPRNNRIADGLHEIGLATVLPDLLRPEEEGDRASMSDIALLAARLFSVAEWAEATPGLRHLPLAYFGAGTGAAAAILAASGPDRRIRAISVRGGRIDLAGQRPLTRIRSPLQMIAGSRDLPIIGLSRAAMPTLGCDHELAIVPGSGHIFKEAAALDVVVGHAARWFLAHLPDRRSKEQ
ncbi:MAG: dienelactone hydrolase family protein [Sphingobium sp.]